MEKWTKIVMWRKQQRVEKWSKGVMWRSIVVWYERDRVVWCGGSSNVEKWSE